MGKIYRIPAQKVEVGLLECRNGFGTLKTTDTGADFPVFACTEVFENPKATASTGCLGATALPSEAATTVTEGITQPDYPRSLQMVASAAATSVVTAYGYDQFGNAINEAFTLNGTSDVLGTKVFASITKFVLATRSDGAANLTVGFGKILGTSRRVLGLALDGAVFATSGGKLASVQETTRPVKATTAGVQGAYFNTALAATNTYILRYHTDEIR